MLAIGPANLGSPRIPLGFPYGKFIRSMRCMFVVVQLQRNAKQQIVRPGNHSISGTSGKLLINFIGKGRDDPHHRITKSGGFLVSRVSNRTSYGFSTTPSSPSICRPAPLVWKTNDFQTAHLGACVLEN